MPAASSCRAYRTRRTCRTLQRSTDASDTAPALPFATHARSTTLFSSSSSRRVTDNIEGPRFFETSWGIARNGSPIFGNRKSSEILVATYTLARHLFVWEQSPVHYSSGDTPHIMILPQIRYQPAKPSLVRHCGTNSLFSGTLGNEGRYSDVLHTNSYTFEDRNTALYHVPPDTLPNFVDLTVQSVIPTRLN